MGHNQDGGEGEGEGVIGSCTFIMIQTQYLEPLLQAKVSLNIVFRNRLISAQRTVEKKKNSQPMVTKKYSVP